MVGSLATLKRKLGATIAARLRADGPSPPVCILSMTGAERGTRLHICERTDAKGHLVGACRILILEDDPLMSAHMESIIEATIEAEIVVSSTIAEANAALDTPLDFALLDVDVLDGTTYAFAETLSVQGVSFAFVSASDRAKMPAELRHAPFIAKPYAAAEIAQLLKTSVRPE